MRKQKKNLFFLLKLPIKNIFLNQQNYFEKMQTRNYFILHLVKLQLIEILAKITDTLVKIFDWNIIKKTKVKMEMLNGNIFPPQKNIVITVQRKLL